MKKILLLPLLALLLTGCSDSWQQASQRDIRLLSEQLDNLEDDLSEIKGAMVMLNMQQVKYMTNIIQNQVVMNYEITNRIEEPFWPTPPGVSVEHVVEELSGQTTQEDSE